MGNKRALPDEIEFPCSYCCKPMKFSKQIFLKGGTVKCKECGMSVVFKPHPNAGRKKAEPKRWRGQSPFAFGGGHDKSPSGLI